MESIFVVHYNDWDGGSIFGAFKTREEIIKCFNGLSEDEMNDLKRSYFVSEFSGRNELDSVSIEVFIDEYTGENHD